MAGYSCKNIILGALTLVALLQGPSSYANLITADEIRQDRRNNQDCFQAHLLEAIHTNMERKELYKDLTKGKSKKITHMLLLAERFGLVMAYYFDVRSRPFQKKGMTIMCDELISTRPVPPFQAYAAPRGLVPDKFMPANGRALAKQLKKALKEKGLEEVGRITQAKLAELALRPSFNCLIRNDLNTIVNTARLTNQHIEESKRLGLKSSESLSLALLNRVIAILPMVDSIDEDAFPLQKAGVPIICQDFPEASPKL
ncbi:MAG: hypothetical protein A2X86_08840 [Bdellovibrionales bacterium GWA2_49_15]|nr:MAG: hypothetical protein A2X86_08840 [Bdellovibrionales bacterium GWA2_49_15]HAZ12883.1 hypothetical protein [Bdellovibrionales bacterium]